ncbi:hypothetical protein [Sporosarcina sp. FA9]
MKNLVMIFLISVTFFCFNAVREEVGAKNPFDGDADVGWPQSGIIIK